MNLHLPQADFDGGKFSMSIFTQCVLGILAENTVSVIF